MKNTKLLITFILFILFSITITKLPVSTAERKVIYFKEPLCVVCKELEGYPLSSGGDYIESHDYIKKMEDQGITVIIHDIFSSTESNDLFAAYKTSYGIGIHGGIVPVIFAGDAYFDSLKEIQEAVDSFSIYTLSGTPLNDVTVVEGGLFEEIHGVAGFITILFAGLLDGVNPCAIAMLLLFVSLLGFTDNKRILIFVSITYIFALFISYFLIGTFLMTFLNRYASEAYTINRIINWIIALLCSFLFLFNLYDFFMSRMEKYEKVKNQLPKWIIKFNKKLIKAFTDLMNDEENQKGLVSVLILTFVLGISLSFTELLCTGQIYVVIVQSIRNLDGFYAYVALLSYNVMFVVPLIIIAVISIKGRGIMSTSNFIREHLHIIKMLNALLFLVIAIYFFSRLI